MKNVFRIIAATLLLVTTACTTDNEWDYTDYTLPGTQGGFSSDGTTEVASLGELTSFDINIDETALAESETIDGNDEDYIENNDFTTIVNIAFSEGVATVSGLVDGITSTCSGADVIISSSIKGVNYIVSGSTSDGMLKIYSDKKYQLTLNGVSITNNNGPAVNLQSGKRAYVVVADGTVNTLTDGNSYAASEEDQKGTLFCEGKLLFSGSGKLDVYANTKNGIAADDYIKFRPNNNIHVKSTAGHAIKANDSIIVKGGVINVETSASAAKGIKSDGLIRFLGGRTTAITSGNGEYDIEEQDCSGAAGVKTDSVLIVDGGTLLCKSTGTGGKGIKADQDAYFNGGNVKVITTGKIFTYGRTDAKAKGIKVDGNLYINGGTMMVRTTGGEGSEGIESKAVMTISGGNVLAYCYDDCLNSSSHMYIKGGALLTYSTGNDGIDANGNMYIQGGTTVAYGTHAPECGIDANEEDGYSVIFTGGNLFAIGGGNSVPNNSSDSTQGYVTTSGSISAGTATVKSGETTLATFNLPASYSNGSILVTAGGMKNNSSYTLTIGSSSTTLTASQYGSNSMSGSLPGGRR